MSIVRALALYEFQASADVELALKPGDIVIVKKKNAGDGWCEGELNGKRGLFPKAYVRLITFGKAGDEDDDDDESTDVSPTPMPNFVMTTPPVSSPSLSKSLHSTPSQAPLTPMSSKKAFMETMLTPTPDTIKKVYNLDKVRDLFVTANEEQTVAIGSGPTWKNRPPSLTIAVHDSPRSIRSSGVKMQKTYDVSTKELKISVIRKYKHFLWLYDQLAEKFPCISLPPIPIKQSQLLTRGPSFVDAQRRGLERFLNRLSRHPVLGHAKIFHLFLTATDEKEWRIGTGKHTSLYRSGGTKSSKKFLSAPIYHSVQYPPYNVPLNQLPSFDKFSKFSGIVDVNLSNMQKACETLKNMHGQMGNCLRSFGKDVQNLAMGADQPSLGARYRKPTQGVVSLPNSQLNGSLLPLTTTSPDENSDDDTPNDSIGEWNWRDDERFSFAMTQLHDLGSCIRQTSLKTRRHQESLTKGVIEGLEEYSGIIHTLPVLVKLHEDAMAVYNESKQKGSKMEAEDVRQDCETLNNILLAEFDYFSEQMTEDLHKLVMSLLKEEADYHRKMAADWDNLYSSFSQKKPIRRATIKRRTTLPGGSHSVDESSSMPSLHPPRPCSSDRNLNVSPSSIKRPYVNVTVNKQNFEEPVYENLPNQKKEKTRESAPTYENWTPKIKKPEQTVATPHNPVTPSSSLPMFKRPIPPPLVIKRHERKSDQSEAERLGSKTDSFIVPSLAQPHYSQIIVGSSLEQHEEEDQAVVDEEEDEEWIKQKAKIEEMGRAIFSKVQENNSVDNDMKESNNDEDQYEQRRSTLTPEYASRHAQKTDNDNNIEEKSTRSIEKGEDLITKVESTKKHDRSTASSSHMTKLAQLTQLPGRSDFTSVQDGLQSSSKSFSFQSQTYNAGGQKSKSSRTLPKGRNTLQSNHSFDQSQTELIKKLEKQRRRLDRQLSSDHLVTRSADDSILKGVEEDKNLSMFGIEEDEAGGSFIV